MAFTDPNNLIDPEILGDYARAQYFEAIRVVRSGILEEVPNTGIDMGGSLVQMPQWEIIGDGGSLAPGAEIPLKELDDHVERHPVYRYYNGIANLDLAKFIAKGDPNAEVGRQVATNTARNLNRAAIATIQGCAAANSGNAISDTSASPAASDITALEAEFGDINEQVLDGTGILLMSSTAYYLYKGLGIVQDPTVGDALQDDIVSGNRFSGFRGELLGHSILVDDELYRAGLTSKTSGDLLTYLIGVGALKTALQSPLNVEQDRNIKTKADEITWDVHQTMGIKGMDYTATPNKQGPTEADLRNSSNWALVAEDSKLVPLASIQTSAS